MVVPNGGESYTKTVASRLEDHKIFDIHMSVHHEYISKLQQDATFLDLFISASALHVSGGSSTRQEHKTVNIASGIVN